MSIAEKRLPQDGRIQIRVAGKEVDLRVSSVPSNHGESIVMRILDKTSLMLGLPELGFLSDDQDTFNKLIRLPDGIILVTGPTGSGKTTTLYGCLNTINTSDRKIITVEDPVEYELPGINQVMVKTDIGMTFAAALRAMMRQAPNIIMVGEIRDKETASIAIQAALTGHLVFSTLHTNDAPGAVARLAYCFIHSCDCRPAACSQTMP
jgi:type II secretory ATPase GspE/PulE/Tfp pilus assembly ATPase PilB-like protein